LKKETVLDNPEQSLFIIRTMEALADLHIHTTYSDGARTPEDMFIRLENIGMKAFSITDHDTVEGCVKAFEIADKYDIEFIPGIEMSCHEKNKEYHLLGYNIDVNNDKLREHLHNFRFARLNRAEKILQKLKRVKIDIDIDYVLQIAGEAPIARPHIATAMINMKYASSWKEAFLLYLGDGRPGYVDKANFPISEAIKMINQAGGVASLAHPARSITQDTLYRVIEYGLDGIEVFHPMHDEALRNYYQTIAGQYWLLGTGGSDFHGNREFDEFNLGKIAAPYSVVESIKMHSIK
jgi:predicted metal-dependent phosphoesterase TrpH